MQSRRAGERSLYYLGLGKGGPGEEEEVRMIQASWRPCSSSGRRMPWCCLGWPAKGWLLGQEGLRL